MGPDKDTINLSLIEFDFFDGVNILDEGPEGFRMSLEEVEEGDDAHGLQARAEDRPIVPQHPLLLFAHLPHLGILELTIVILFKVLLNLTFVQYNISEY